MKLRNKKTGEIAELHFVEDKEYHFTVSPEDPADMCIYKTLSALNEEWEDYEEPKEFWFIGEDCCPQRETFTVTKDFSDRLKQIGNYFEAKEEAEKAVEKLKAWKRLKDKGFRFDVVPSLGHRDDEKFDISIIATMPAKWWYNDKVVDDIHCVFGGEE